MGLLGVRETGGSEGIFPLYPLSAPPPPDSHPHDAWAPSPASIKGTAPHLVLCQGRGPCTPLLSIHQWILWTHPPKHVRKWHFLPWPGLGGGSGGRVYSSLLSLLCSPGPAWSVSGFPLSVPHHSLPRPGPLPGAPHLPTHPGGPAHACTCSAHALPLVQVPPGHWLMPWALVLMVCSLKFTRPPCSPLEFTARD